MKLELKESSWENIFETVRSMDTSIKSKGNFWTAIQSLEDQIENIKRGD